MEKIHSTFFYEMFQTIHQKPISTENHQWNLNTFNTENRIFSSHSSNDDPKNRHRHSHRRIDTLCIGFFLLFDYLYGWPFISYCFVNLRICQCSIRLLAIKQKVQIIRALLLSSSSSSSSTSWIVVLLLRRFFKKTLTTAYVYPKWHLPELELCSIISRAFDHLYKQP